MKLVFIPGAACGKTAWLCQTLYFIGSEAIALPGHPEGKPYPSIDGYVEWLRGYLQKQPYQDIVLCGHSMGGAVAQQYGLSYGASIKALVLIGTGARLRIHPDLLKLARDMAAGKLAWRDYLEERHATTVPEARQMMIEERMRIGPAVLLNDLLACDSFDVMAEIHNIKLPTLVICGRDDELAPVKYAHYLTSQIEDAREVIVPGAAHWVLSEKPGEVNQAIGSFLSGLA
jgi:pimeloyl-ACP methyl ester carboxylesterase